MKKILFALILMLMSVSIYSQTPSNTIFTNGDRINIELSTDLKYYYVHELLKGQSLYALSKIFAAPLNDIYKLNNIKEGATLSIGQRVKIPVLDKYLFKGSTLEGLQNGHYIPVYYKTLPKDNLFRISRIYFSQGTEDLITRNNLKDNNLSLGQEILIGWLPIGMSAPVIQNDEFEEDFDIEDPSISPTEDYLYDDTADSDISRIAPESTLDSINASEAHPIDFNLSLLGSLKYSKAMKEVRKSEVAHWDKSMPDNGMVYVLHNKAIIDSHIEMYNPILKRSVRAKVIGRIPYGAYTKNVCLVLSPRAAIQLGALDNRFKVEVTALFYEVK